MKRKTDDPFFRQFFERVPTDVANTFTDDQLDAVKLAFATRSRVSHAVDIRLSIPLLVHRVYVVFLAGRERRPAGRRRWERTLRPVWTPANAIIIFAFLILLTAATFTVVSAGKRTFGIGDLSGIDVFPDKALERIVK